MTVDTPEVAPEQAAQIIEGRLNDLKAQRFQVQTRVDAPALGEPEGGSEADKAALEQLNKSIATLEKRKARAAADRQKADTELTEVSNVKDN